MAIIMRVCKHCGRQKFYHHMNPRYKGYCTFCFQDTGKRYKEKCFVLNAFELKQVQSKERMKILNEIFINPERQS